MADKKYAFGLDKNIACALTYSLGWVSGLIFFLVEKEDKDIRFNALQSIVVFGAANLIVLVPIIGWMLSPVVSIAAIVAWIFLIVKNYQGQTVKLPVVGDFVEAQLKKM